MNEDYADQRPRCPLTHQQRTEPPLAARNAALCQNHIDDVWQKLDQLASFDSHIAEAARDTALARKNAQPLSGNRPRPGPIADRPADHMVDVAGILRAWADRIVEERHIHAPLLADFRATAGLCAFLRRHHGWSVAQPWADDYATEILELGRKAESLLNPKGNRSFTHKVMRCIHVDVEEDPPARCPGSVWAYLTPDDALFVASSALVCDTCGSEWTASEWMTFGRKLRELGEVA